MSSTTSRKNSSNTAIPVAPSQQAGLPIISKSKFEEQASTERSSDFLSHAASGAAVEERTIREQVIILGAELRRCSGEVQKQGELLTSYLETAKIINSVETENRKLKHDLYAPKKENDNLRSAVKSHADQLMCCRMPPKDSIEAKTHKLNRRLHDIQLRNVMLGKRLDNFFFGLVKPTTEEVSKLIDDVSSWSDGYRPMNYRHMNFQASSSKLGAALMVKNESEEEPAQPRTPEANNTTLTIRTALAEETLECARFGPAAVIPFLEVRNMTTAQAPPSFPAAFAEASTAICHDASAEETPTAELDAVPAVFSAIFSDETSSSDINSSSMPCAPQSSPTSPAQQVESNPTTASAPPPTVINTPLPPSPPLPPHFETTQDSEAGSEADGNGIKTETTEFVPWSEQEITAGIKEVSRQINHKVAERERGLTKKKGNGIPWSSANWLLLFFIVLCCIVGSVRRAFSVYDTMFMTSAAAGLYVLVLLLL